MASLQSKFVLWGRGVAHENINTVQIGLTHLFLLNSLIAPVDLMNLWSFDSFPSRAGSPPPCWLENILWYCMGQFCCRRNYIFTFFYLFHCIHQIIITHIRYYGFLAIYFAQMEHGTRIGKALKLHLKLISLTKNKPSAINEKWREGERMKWANHRAQFQSRDNNTNEEEACGGKMLQKQQNKQNFAHRFEAFRDH